ncbi:MAG: 2-amino-4-hydroxy-6-hydroxymethyldihydropteridine diphosphokinase [Gammaproteobacteria bacterium]
MHEVYIGAGSNVEPERHLRAGVTALAERYGVLRLSPVYRNSAVGFSGDDFLNMVVAFDTDDTVAELADFLGEVEAASGRNRTDEKFAPRTLDLDILLYGDFVGDAGGMQLPRPEITSYAFVLKPLADLAPDMPHPGKGTSFAELWNGFDASGHPLQPVTLDFTEGS